MNIEYYNHDFKIEVINKTDSQSSVNIYKNLFNQIKAIEKKHNKDLYEFTPKELQDVLNIQSFVVSRSTFNNVKRLLKQYFEYASEHNKSINKDTNDLIQNLDYDNLDISHLVRNKFFHNYISMAIVFNNLIRYSKEQPDTEDNFIIERMCCIVGLLWWGVAPEDIAELTEQDIDKNKNMIHLISCNRRMALPSILIDQCLALSQYECIKRPTGVGMGTFYFADNDKIIKIKKVNRECEAYDMLQNIRQNFMPVFSKRLKELPTELQETYKNYVFQYRDIIRNGRFERYYNKEQNESRFVPTFEDYMTTFDLKRPTAFNEFKTYQQWKKAYGLN